MALALVILLLAPGIAGQVPSPSRQASSAHVSSAPAPGLSPRLSDIFSRINASLVGGYLEDLVAIGPRVNNRAGCEEAAEYIAQQFRSMGLITYTHPWVAWGNRGHMGRFSGRNVVGELPGTDASSDAIFVFNAHYDTVRNTPGADDDASGVAAVLAAARVLSQYRFAHTIKFIAFSGEEVGLLGSHAYARTAFDTGEPIAVEFNADMIGHATGKNGSRFRMYGTEDTVWVMEVVEGLNAASAINFTLTSGFVTRSQQGGSDYASFAQYGYEALAFFEYEWNPHMHTPEDTLDNVNISYLVNTTRLIALSLAELASTPLLPRQVVIDAPQRGGLYVNGVRWGTFSSSRTVVVGDAAVSASLRFGTASVQKVEFYVDDQLVHTDTTAPYSWTVDRLLMGRHEVKVQLYEPTGLVSTDVMPAFFLSW